MIAQDTGSAIVGPARADLYFGAGADAGRVSGRLKHAMRFVMLVPKSLDPLARGRRMPLPEPRPADEIAKLLAPVDPAKDKPNEPSNGANPAETSTPPAKAAEGAKPAVPVQPAVAGAQIAASQAAAPATAVPLPQARPDFAPGREARRPHDHRRYRRGQ